MTGVADQIEVTLMGFVKHFATKQKVLEELPFEKLVPVVVDDIAEKVIHESAVGKAHTHDIWFHGGMEAWMHGGMEA